MLTSIKNQNVMTIAYDMLKFDFILFSLHDYSHPSFYRAFGTACPTKGNQATLQEPTGRLCSKWLPVPEEITGPENQTD